VGSAVAPGEFGTKATDGFVNSNLGPQGTFTNRVQSGSGQAAQHNGYVSFGSKRYPARKGMR